MPRSSSQSALTVDAQAPPARNVKLSVIVPVYNEAGMLDQFLARLLPVLNRLHVRYEIVFVDDGSSDDTLARLVEHRGVNSAIRIVALSRNFGKEAAITAGLDHVRGAAVVPIDCDLQDPPEVIEQLLTKWREGSEVVVATRRAREGETWLKRATASAFYRLFNLVAKQPIPPDTGDFRLLDRKVVQAIRQIPERSRFMKGLFAWVGFQQAAVLYDREPRFHGHSKWSYWRLWNLAIQGITSFSSLPLRVWTYLGTTWVAVCAVLGIVQIVHALFPAIPLFDVAWQSLLLFLLAGIEIIAVGILGEYLGCLMDEVKGRPVYVVRKRYGFRRKPRGRSRDRKQSVRVLAAASEGAETPDPGVPLQPPAAA